MNLLTVRLTQRATKDREVLRVDRDLTAVYLAESSDDAVSVGTMLLESHARCIVTIQHVKFLEGIFVEQIFDSLTSGHPPTRLLTLDRLGASSDTSFRLASFELG